MNEWKHRAEALFFVKHLDVTEIAARLSKARETVSRFINGCEGYEAEMEFRRRNRAKQRREYQRQWDENNRPNRYNDINGETLRREHELASLLLSKEKY